MDTIDICINGEGGITEVYHLNVEGAEDFIADFHDNMFNIEDFFNNFLVGSDVSVECDYERSNVANLILMAGNADKEEYVDIATELFRDYGTHHGEKMLNEMIDEFSKRGNFLKRCAENMYRKAFRL